MPERTSRSASLRPFAITAAVGASYASMAWLGTELAIVGRNVSPVWPATGVSIALLMRFGLRHWPGVLVAAAAVPLFTGTPLWTGGLIGIGNTLEAVAAVTLLRRVGVRRELARVRDVLWLVAFAVVLGPMLSASVGTVAICGGGIAGWDRAPTVFAVWWLGNAMGALIVSPLLLTAERVDAARVRGRVREAVLITLALAGMCVLVFWREGQTFRYPVSEEFLVFPVLIWASLRLGPPGAAVASFLCAALAVFGTASGLGPFARGELTASILVVQLFMAAVALTALLLAAAVAERRSADEQLRLLAAALHSTQDAVFITEAEMGPEGPRIVYVNDALCRLTGYRPEEILGRTPSLLAGPDCKRETILRMRQEMVAGRPFFGEMTNYRKDGSSFPAELQITPVTGSDGRVTHYLSSRRDLTERKQLHAKLSLAERMASIGALAAGVAHEINNPLAFIVSNLDYLRRELQRLPVARERPELHTALSECAAGAERVRAIVRDLKVFSRDAGDERSVVQLNAVVQSALKMAAHEIGTRARVVQELGAPPAVEVNEVRLGQVLLNLLVNAAQAIPPGESRQHEIRVRTGGELHTGAWVEISDTGEGIAPEVLPRIFEPFFTTKDVGVGTGLGLTLCHQLVTAMHGEITVSSTPGRGSTFRVRLPATARTAERVEETPRSPEGGERVEETPRSPEGGERARVLIIDDEPRIGDSTRRVLEPDFEVDVTSRADDALARIEEGRVYEVILCDLHMPGMTGMDFFEVLRERRPALADRVLFFSGGAFTQASQAFVAKHRDVVLEKPVRPERLATAIGEVLARKGRAPAHGAGAS